MEKGERGGSGQLVSVKPGQPVQLPGKEESDIQGELSPGLERWDLLGTGQKMMGKELGEGKVSGQKSLEKQGEIPLGLEKWELPGSIHSLRLIVALDSVREESPLSVSDSLAVVPFADQEPITVEFVTEFSKLVGVSCDGEARKLSEVFGIIMANTEGNGKEVGEAVEEGVALEAHTGKKGKQELNNLNFSINYEGHSGSSLRARNKGRGHRAVQ
ncbi:uncharacterized protein LOC132168638 [Corylus avellana]|uniref:uncharacterized protein LOC132168638 n=1 Tax=Corylus avellana TaxID=13451 RepID=UPI00286A7BD2|nr:uncharacterized protein LOC132168638 [Corylus avellana]